MTSTALHDLGVAQLAAELRARRVSAAEAARHFLDRDTPPVPPPQAERPPVQLHAAG